MSEPDFDEVRVMGHDLNVRVNSMRNIFNVLSAFLILIITTCVTVLAQTPTPIPSPSIAAVEATRSWINGPMTTALASLGAALLVLLGVAKQISNEKAALAVGIAGKIQRGLIWTNDTLWKVLNIAQYVVQVLSAGLLKLIAFLAQLTASDGIGGKQ